MLSFGENFLYVWKLPNFKTPLHSGLLLENLLKFLENLKEKRD